MGGQGLDSMSRQEKTAAVWPGCHNLNEIKTQDLHSNERLRGTRVPCSFRHEETRGRCQNPSAVPCNLQKDGHSRLNIVPGQEIVQQTPVTFAGFRR